MWNLMLSSNNEAEVGIPAVYLAGVARRYVRRSYPVERTPGGGKAEADESQRGDCGRVHHPCRRPSGIEPGEDFNRPGLLHQ